MTITSVTYGTDGKPTAGFTAGTTDAPVEGPLIGAVTETAPGSDTASSGLNGRLQRIAQRLTSLIAMFANGAGTATGALRTTLASDDPAVAALTKTITTATASYTRPADATAYAAGDCLSNSASAPTAGGLSLTVASANGKGGLITDLLVTSSNAPGTPLQGELWLFDTAPTAVNDNAAFTVSDSEILTLVAQIPFALTTIGANSQAHVQGLNIGYTTVSATTLRGLVRVTNAYTPASGEVVSFRLKTTPIG